VCVCMYDTVLYFELVFMRSLHEVLEINA